MTLVHHTVPHVPFLEETRWRDAAARLSYTIHCEYPPGVELLTHHINVHTPHHVSTAIPSYNLRAARASLLENWGQHINEAVFGWGLMKDILSHCQLYEPTTSLYTTFDEFDAATAAGKSPQAASAESSSESVASVSKSPAARKLLRSSGSPRRRATGK
jgi:omega-6 fatty acid desaturase (delta-12 desaturase)